MSRARGTTTRLGRLVALLAVALWSVWVPGSSAAGAHSATGRLELVDVERASGDDVNVTVEFRYDSDDHPVLDGVVTLSGERSDGVAALPVTFSMTEVQGRLAATAALPGPQSWTLRIVSDDPAAELTVDYDPSDPAAAPATARGGEFAVAAPGGGVPVRWIAIGCGAVLLVFAVASLRRGTRDG